MHCTSCLAFHPAPSLPVSWTTTQCHASCLAFRTSAFAISRILCRMHLMQSPSERSPSQRQFRQTKGSCSCRTAGTSCKDVRAKPCATCMLATARRWQHTRVRGLLQLRAQSSWHREGLGCARSSCRRGAHSTVARTHPCWPAAAVSPPLPAAAARPPPCAPPD